MNLLAAVTGFDETLFLLINNIPHTSELDAFFLFFSFYPFVIWTLVGVVVVMIEERKEKLFIIRLLMALFLAGTFASGLIKPIVRRPRPDLSYGEQVVIVTEKPAVLPWNNDFAFPSGHAAVAFAGAYILTREETTGKHGKAHSRKRRAIFRWIFPLFALLTAFSRIYLGKHYPIDVIAGGILGWGMGWVAWKLVDLFAPPKSLFGKSLMR